MRHFLHLDQVGPRTVLDLVARARALKGGADAGKPLAGSTVSLLFMNPSLRTRVSLETATVMLGGHPIALSVGGDTWNMETRHGVVMNGAAQEHVREAIPVLGRYSKILGLRSFPHGKSWEEDRQEPALSAFRDFSTIPVVNMESAMGHPLQALADLMTVSERMEPAGKTFLLTWAPHIKPLPMAVPSSAAEVAAIGGMNVRIARPPGYDLDPEVMARIQASCRANGRVLEVTDDPEEAYRGAHVVYAKAWGSLETYGEPPPSDEDWRRRWTVSVEKMERTGGAIFMHCLPVRRNLVVADGVLDGPWSVVVDEAENRLHTARAVLEWQLGEGNTR